MTAKTGAPRWTPRRLALPAAAISLLAPGLGHLLIGLKARAVTWLVGYIALALMVGASGQRVLLILSAFIALDAFVLAMDTPDPPVADEADDTQRKEDSWKPLS